MARLQWLHRHLEHLARGRIRITMPDAWPSRILRLTVEGLTVGIAVEGQVDLQKALSRVTKQRNDNLEDLQRLESKLTNADFCDHAPAEVVEEHRQRSHRLQHEQTMLSSSERQLRHLLASPPA
jgi:valyl-tRNA synthetase